MGHRGVVLHLPAGLLLDLEDVREIPEDDPDHDHRLEGSEVLVVERRSRRMPCGEQFVLV
jgi:hypothetical protein